MVIRIMVIRIIVFSIMVIRIMVIRIMVILITMIHLIHGSSAKLTYVLLFIYYNIHKYYYIF